MDVGRLYDPEGSIAFHDFMSIIEGLEAAVENGGENAEVKMENLKLPSSVRSLVSSHVESNNSQLAN